MKIKFTFLFRYHEETKDTDAYAQFLTTKIIPNILKVKGVSHIELCHFVPFSFGMQSDEFTEEKHVLQMDIYYEGEEQFHEAMMNFNDSYLVEEIIKALEYTDIYISYITKHEKETDQNV